MTLSFCLDSCVPGNLGQLFNSKGLPFHQELVDRFGGMVKVYGFFGVGLSFFRCSHSQKLTIFQRRNNYISLTPAPFIL